MAIKLDKSNNSQNESNAAGSQKQNIQVIARAAEILRTLQTSQTSMSLGQIANRTGLARSTVQRIVASLQAEDFVVADVKGSGFRLGSGIIKFGKATRYDVVELCRPFLTRLMEVTKETADLSVMRHDKMVFLDQVPGPHRLRTVSFVGETFPLTDTANGKACLARLSKGDAQIMVENEWRNNNMKGDMNAFLKNLDQIKMKGLAFDIDEHSAGISAIGFSFEDRMGGIYAISVPVPSTRFIHVRQDIEQELLSTLEQINEAIG